MQEQLLWRKVEPMKKKNQKLTVYVVVAVLIISLVGTSFVFMGDLLPSIGNNYQGKIDKLEQALAANPQDTQTRLDLANVYYDWGMRAVAQNFEEGDFESAVSILKKAIAEYQEVLKTEKTPGILVDMATAATYAQEYEVAEKAFQEALELDPNFYEGLYNYGFYLYVVNDFGGAIEQWEKAKALDNLSNDNIKRLERNISLAQDALLAQFQQTDSNASTEAESEAE